MAKAVGLIGGLKGKVGNTVFATLRGETIARVYQPIVTNPNTFRQQVSRMRFETAGKLSRAMLDALRIGFNNVASGREYQQGVKQIVTNGVVSINAAKEQTINYPLLQLSYNEIGAFVVGAPDFETEGSVTFTYNVPEAVAFGDESSQSRFGMVAVVYSPDFGYAIVKESATTLKVGDIKVDVPADWSGVKVYVYAFVKRIIEAKNGVPDDQQPWRYPSKASQTMYVGTGDIA